MALINPDPRQSGAWHGRDLRIGTLGIVENVLPTREQLTGCHPRRVVAKLADQYRKIVVRSCDLTRIVEQYSTLRVYRGNRDRKGHDVAKSAYACVARCGVPRCI